MEYLFLLVIFLVYDRIRSVFRSRRTRRIVHLSACTNYQRSHSAEIELGRRVMTVLFIQRAVHASEQDEIPAWHRIARSMLRPVQNAYRERYRCRCASS